MSSVFNETTDASTIAAALAVLQPASAVDSATVGLDRELLTAWLNFANGALSLDDSAKITDHLTETLAQAITEAETVRLAPNATKPQLSDERTIVNTFNHLHDS